MTAILTHWYLIFRAFCLTCVLTFVAGTAWADPATRADPPAPLTADERSVLHGLVQSQLDAFRRDDGETAFGLSGSRAHAIYTDAEDFMKTIRETYPPLYRPRTVLFAELVETNSGPIQILFVGGQDGLSYIAFYTFERQSDGSWLIAGCLLRKNPVAGI
jgi:hypothetical protein